MNFEAFNGAVTGTSVYKSKISRNGLARQHVFNYAYQFAGTMTGTLVIEGSNSIDDLLEQDKAGGTDTTDKAVWLPCFAIGAAGTLVTSVAISAAVSAALHLASCTFKAVRVKYTNATNDGTLIVTVTSRRA